MSAPPEAAPAPLIETALKGLCPRCGAPGLFEGMTRFRPLCPACGLDRAAFNVGDGPAAFLTLVIGAIIVALALTVELTLHPPLWLHVILWTPFTAAAVIAGLRVSKAAMLALEYRNAAGEGRSAR